MAFDNTSTTFPQINQRRTAAGIWDLNAISGEAFTTSLDADSFYSAQLAEVPAAANTDGSNSAPSMANSGGGGSYTLTTSTTPGVGEFYVDYDNGVVIVNSSDHTSQSGAFEMTYSGKGTVLKADEINAILTSTTTLNSNIVTSSLTTVGALASGSIAAGFGAIDNGTSNITTGGILKIDVDGTAENAAGSLTLGAGNDAGIFFDGTDLVIITNGAGASGIILDSEDDTVEIKGSGTLQATFDTSGLNLVSGDAYYIAGTSVLNATTLGTGVVTSSLTTVGTLGSLTVTGNVTLSNTTASRLLSTDGSKVASSTSLNSWVAGTSNQISVADDGDGTITLSTPQDIGTGSNVQFNQITGTLQTAAQTNITQVGTLTSFASTGIDDNATSTAITIDASENVGIGTSSIDQKLHVEGSSGDTRIKLEDTSANSSVFLNLTNDARTWQVENNGSNSDSFIIRDATAGSVRFSIDSSGNTTFTGGKIATNNESAPDCDTGGITLKAGGNAFNVITIKNSAQTHPFTTQAESDTVSQFGNGLGGAYLAPIWQGYSGGAGYMILSSHIETETTDDTTSSAGAITLNAFKTDGGTSRAAIGSTGNVFSIRNGNSNTGLLMKGNGDLHVQNTTLTALDSEDDIQLVEDARYATAKEFKHRVSKEAFQNLIDKGILGRDGSMMKLQGLTALKLGAIGQLWNMIRELGKSSGIDEKTLKEWGKNYGAT